MPKIKYTYWRNDLQQLFDKEESVLERIKPYCNRVKAKVKIQYLFSIGKNLQFTLIITVDKEYEE